MAIFSLVLVVLIASYAQGRYLSEWIVNTDPALIDESLRKSFRHIDFGSDTRPTTSDAVNVICRTQIRNGIHIELSFDVQKKRRKCLLYKSPVEILPIKFETCDIIEEGNLSEQEARSNDKMTNSEQEDEEARIDALNLKIKDEEKYQQPNNVDQTEEKPLNEERNGNTIDQVEKNEEERDDVGENDDESIVDRQSNGAVGVQEEGSDEKTNNEEPKLDSRNQQEVADEKTSNEEPILDSKKQQEAADNEDNEEKPHKNMDNRVADGADNHEEEGNREAPRENDANNNNEEVNQQ